MKFSEGEQVLAKMPSSDDYQKARIVNVKGNKYKVLFRGGEEYTVNETDLKAQRTSRSQTRSRGRPSGKSPSRSSPSRRSPARKSPARSPNSQSRKLPVRNARQAKISIARLEIPKDNSSDTDRTEGSESLKDEFVEPPIQSRLRELGPITRRSIRIMSGVAKAEHDHKLMMLTRNIDRAASLPVERKAQYNALSDGKERGLSVQPEEDIMKSIHYEDFDLETFSEGKTKEIDFLSKPQEWGGWIGALLLIIAIPVCTILLQIACSNNHCSSKKFHVSLYKEWKLFLNLEAFLSYAGFLCFVAIISVLPIGRLIDGQQSIIGRLQYRINGIWILILSLIIFGGFVYKGYNISDFLIKNSLSLSVAGLTYGILLAVALYVKGGRMPVSNLNIYGSTNNIIYDFWQGREINPRLGPLDFKLILLRCALIGTILINLAAIVKINQSIAPELNNLNYIAIEVALLQIVHAADNLVFESSAVTSFEITYEGTGFMLITRYLTYPFLATLTTRYLLTNKINKSIYLIGLFTVFFCVGYAIYRVSNSMKDKFRKNPFEPSLSHLETIPTKRGKRLIVSRLWGHVRHPNYLGDIIMHWSISCLSFATDFLPYIFAIQLTLLLIHRAVRDNARCGLRYGYAWKQYCSRVKYMILNRVF
ncbi:PREDICTED: delta(14)-sterol reductase isoform X2 [Ceratosolen solmsi marchali]|uniref:Delta(14)-sterol reductase isoform X2 n=1 Tax=Ceratosolen solmsi marchali TaxID=326594 RepID=A0AAJ6YTW4_9HYME|nr:PREDICTED: delta(14)-sterol reductase isoform X2 [Ceratosolen solmsi marchali]